MKKFWVDRPTLVTGASGFLGSWLTKKLVALGADVVVLIRDWIPQSELILSHDIQGVKIVRGDVREQALVERVLNEYEINSVFHLAAQTIVGIANCNPVSTFESNIRGTWSLLEACRRSPSVKQIVTASSDKAYGMMNLQSYNEKSPLNAEFPYDVSKACADIISQSYAKSFEVPVVITRCGNLFGGGDLNWNRLVPGTIRSLLRNERPIIRSDGNYSRDFFYVEDCVEAYLLLAERLSVDSNLRGEAFNFSSDCDMSVSEVVSEILSVARSKLKPKVLDNVKCEIRKQHLDCSKAKKILGWSPSYPFKDGLKSTIQWYKKFLLLHES